MTDRTTDRPTDRLTKVKCKAISFAKKWSCSWQRAFSESKVATCKLNNFLTPALFLAAEVVQIAKVRGGERKYSTFPPCQNTFRFGNFQPKKKSPKTIFIFFHSWRKIKFLQWQGKRKLLPAPLAGALRWHLTSGIWKSRAPERGVLPPILLRVMVNIALNCFGGIGQKVMKYTHFQMYTPNNTLSRYLTV